jgi:hypothetical protein
MRPIYERDEDRRRQREAVAVLEQATGLRAVETARLAGWDFEVLRADGTVAGLVEVKCRRHEHDHYPTYIISRAKVIALAQACREHGCMGGLLVAWRDRTGWLRVENRRRNHWPTITGGRRDRNDPADIEAMYEIPVTDFRFIP